MYLKSLEISGFKSFAKKMGLEFSTSITGIVGPNGSGKSNVAEAFRFVLGEQSMKSMRGKRTEDLIWNGSESVPRSNRASVKLTFDNTLTQRGGVSRRLFDIDFDTVTLERIIHRDSSSEYLVNGSPVRLKDIVEMLANAHIGASGHHIISQGEADRVLSVNPRERKAMIEDALGLKIYHYKKDESIRKLEKTDENIEKVESLRREIKPHLSFLEKQVAKLEKARELADTLTQAYKEYFAQEKAYIEGTKKRLHAEEAPYQSQQETIEQRLKDAEQTLRTLERADEKTRNVLTLEEGLTKAREARERVERDSARVEGEIEALKRQREREERRLREARTRAVEVHKITPHLEKLESALSAVGDDGNLTSLQTLYRAVRAILASLKTAISGESDMESSVLNEIDVTLRELHDRHVQLQAQQEQVRSDEAEAQRVHSALQSEIEADRTSSREAERSVFTLSRELADVKAVLSRISATRATLALEEEELKRDLGEAGIIAGREALSFVPRDEETALSEHRSEQHDRKRSLERMKIRLEDSGIAGADDVMKEYKEVEERDLFLGRELDDLRASADALLALITELDETLSREFAVGLEKINIQFTEFFAVMFGGGTAKLTLVKEAPRKRKSIMDDEIPDDDVDAEEELAEGVEIAIDLPRKKVRSLEMLSGGERALTSIALIFAMSQVNPPPFIILDETDAALDEANSRRYGDMIENLAQHTQLLLITHNRETMSRAGVLYGVTMGRDASSQLLSVSFTDAVAVAK